MTHEFKKIVATAFQYQLNAIPCVLATVVDLEGSSYRKPGVQMLIAQDGTMTGAVSGGCVEKEIILQSQKVFKDNVPLVMTYDGRYRLGCEGILYILIEPFKLTEEAYQILTSTFRARKSFTINSRYIKEEVQSPVMGSYVKLKDSTIISFSEIDKPEAENKGLEFSQEMRPLFQLLIIGGEHDAVQLCAAASLMGWQVEVVTSPKDPKSIQNFPGAHQVYNITPGEIDQIAIDSQTAVVLMNHSYATDLKFLLSLANKNPVYIGLIGAAKRREKLLNELIEFYPEINDTLLDKIYGPAGLQIGAITPQEIAISVLAEILSVIRDTDVFSLREIQGKIHS